MGCGPPPKKNTDNDSGLFLIFEMSIFATNKIPFAATTTTTPNRTSKIILCFATLRIPPCCLIKQELLYAHEYKVLLNMMTLVWPAAARDQLDCLHRDSSIADHDKKAS